MLDVSTFPREDFQFVTTPFDHQYLVWCVGIKVNELGIFMDLGTGKSKTLIDIIRWRLAKEQIRNALIVCPAHLLANWENEIKTHSRLHYTILYGTREKRKKLLARPSHIYVINYEALDILKDDKGVFPTFDLVGLDESHKIRNWKTKACKNAAEVAYYSKYRYLLCGTPIINSPADVFGQFLSLDSGATFGLSPSSFTSKYLIDKRRPGSTQPKWEARSKEAEAEIKELIYTKAIRVMKEDCMDLPPRVYQRRKVELTPELRKHYKSMAEDLLVELGDDMQLLTPNLMTQLLKFQQICSGFIIDKESVIHPLGESPKLTLVREILNEEIPNKKAIIWCAFRHEVNILLREFKDRNPVAVVGGQKPAERWEINERFQKDDNCQLLIGIAKSGGTGINLTAADTAIYFSNTWSPDDRWQSEGRNHRSGSEIHKSITYIDCPCERTIEERIIQVLSNKGEMKGRVVDVRKMLFGTSSS